MRTATQRQQETLASPGGRPVRARCARCVHCRGDGRPAADAATRAGAVRCAADDMLISVSRSGQLFRMWNGAHTFLLHGENQPTTVFAVCKLHAH